MDTIGNFLTSIRNANMRQKERVDVPLSNLKVEISRILKDEGFITNYKALVGETSKRAMLRVFLKYSAEKEQVIRGIKRVSKPGLRVYRGYEDIPKGRGGFSVTILSTPKGVMTDRQARSQRLGGEILCQVW
ncbi:MAG: 30S ribosomal protein S8 [Elusimicrobia bacterium]|nr:30S ribosomal protein S8 [Elusimicrobiota bacterium]